MKKTIIILTLIYITALKVQAFDFYPELETDPMMSPLNPTYINKEEVNQNDDNQDTLFSIIKNKFNGKKDKNKENKKAENTDNDTVEENTINNEKTEEKTEENTKEETKEIPISEKKPLKIKKEKSFSEKTGEQKVAELEKEEREKKKLEDLELKKKNSFISPSYNTPYSSGKYKDNSDKGLLFSLKNKLPFFKSQEKAPVNTVENPQIELTADYMEYFPDRYEVEAIGNAKVEFKKENTILTANKIVYNYDRNILKANEDVVLTTDDAVTEGDFIKLDLNKPEGWIENPITNTDDIKLSAKEAFVYSDKIEEYDGVAKILRNEVMAFRANSFASYVDQSGVMANMLKNSANNPDAGLYSLKAKTIYIDSQKDHEVITIKNADLYLKKFRIAAIPSTRIVSNKQNNVIESNIPEIGSQSLLGAHIGPAVVLNVPGGSTLKLAPILTYSKEKLGIGGIARFRNQFNMTEVAYGTSRDELLIRGRQKLAPGLLLNYSRYTNESEWFLGYRKPKYAAELNYSRSDYVKDLKLTFSQRYSAGAFVDDRRGYDDFRDAEARFRWMTQTYKPIYSLKNEEGNLGFSAGIVAQTAASVYTTGDVLGLFRIGPSLNTKIGPWTQALMYLQTGSAGESPFYFDRYRYGKSNVTIFESLKVCKYLSLGYLASIAMNREVKSDDLFQENRFLVSVGPEYARLSVGYDALRQNTMLILSMLVGTKDSNVEFKKSVLKNPENFGKKSKTKKTKKKNYKKYLKDLK